MDREALERQLRELPLYQYEFIRTQDLVFSDKVRYICRTECSMYGKSWACPPAVGDLDACKARCLSFPEGLIIVTISEVEDIANLEQTLETRAPHEEITRQVSDMMRPMVQEMMVLSTESCAICEHCAYPDGPCRFPERMYPCVESHGILVTEMAERCGIDFLAGGNIVTWFSLILYRE